MNRYLIRYLTLSQPPAFLESSARISCKTLSLLMATSVNDELHGGKKLGIVLPVDVSEHCCTKKSFKMFALIST